MKPPCPCCEGPLGDPFYTLDDVPVHSCLMLATPEAALRFPTGSVRLAACESCGFVTNLDFDPRWSAYGPDYEDQQVFSGTFNAFAGDLARSLVERYGLSGRAVVEIGCSKGDFLFQLCEAGAVRAVGIDPGAVAGRVPVPARGTLRLIPECYSDAHLAHPADLICCRHTLEHIHDIRPMLARMARHLAQQPGATLFLEVPDAGRIWREAAFEDVYYEHCSYFTPGALARALRHAGFALLDLRLDYDGQYLVAEACLDPGRNRRFEIEDPPAEVLARTRDFESRVRARTDRWRGALSRDSTGFAIWGSGSKCLAFLKAVDPRQGPVLIVDINPHRWGKHIPGLATAISEPGRLPVLNPARVIVMNPIYLAEIAALCRKIGYSGDLRALRRG